MFRLTSPAFKDGEPIPSAYTCEGKDISHALVWTDPPANAASFALINDDPDCHPAWTHWIIYNIPGARRDLPDHVLTHDKLEDGTLQGINSFGKVGYGGPCPPRGTHRYFFKLYALDCILPLPPKATRDQLDAAMKGHILGKAQLMGTYIKKKR